MASLFVTPVGAQPAAHPAQEAVPLTVMSFIIWVGGTRVDFDQVSAAVRDWTAATASATPTPT